MNSYNNNNKNANPFLDKIIHMYYLKCLPAFFYTICLQQNENEHWGKMYIKLNLYEIKFCGEILISQ